MTSRENFSMTRRMAMCARKGNLYRLYVKIDAPMPNE